MEAVNNISDLESVLRVVLAFNSVSNHTVLLDTILTNMMEITNSDAGTLYLLEDKALHFRILKNKTLGINEVYDEKTAILPSINLDAKNIQNISAYTAIKNEVVLIDDVYSNKSFDFTGTKKYDWLTGYSTKSMFVFPICAQHEHGEEVLGVLQLINPIDPVTGKVGNYSDVNNKSLVLALTKISASTLANVAHVGELQGFLRAFATTLTQAIDERSRYTGSHTQNVAQYCESFVKHLGRMFPEGHALHFDPYHVESITMAALLHDIGKIVIPVNVMDKSDRLSDKLDAILYRFGLKKLQIEIEFLKNKITRAEFDISLKNLKDVQALIEQVNAISYLTEEHLRKIIAISDLEYVSIAGKTCKLLDAEDVEALSIKRGTLTIDERKMMEEHVEITSRLLERIPFSKYYVDVPLWAGAHHELLDGSGYPKGLKGAEIPIETCIITIMDIFDALIDQNRPYKDGVPLDKALDILQDMANDGKLHKELVRLFIESKIWENLERY